MLFFPPLRFRYTFELYLTSDKVYQFGAETAEVLHTWTSAIGKVRYAVPIAGALSPGAEAATAGPRLLRRPPRRSAVTAC